MAEIPHKIYRYQSFSALSIDTLCNDQLYFSNPSNFNDPLDCKPSIECDSDKNTLQAILSLLIERRVTEEVLASLKAAKVKGEDAENHAKVQGKQEAINQINNIAYHATNPDYQVSAEEAEINLLTYEIQSELQKQNNRGICCFSEEYDNPLLWSHYGDQHNGYCVGYSLDRNPKPFINKVIYGGLRTVKTSLIYQALINQDSGAQETLDSNVLLRKADPWAYEKEWRIFESIGLQDSPLKLEEVIFGLRCSSSVVHCVIEALKPRDVNFYCMYSEKESFKLKRTNDFYEACAFLPRTAYSGVEAFGSLDEDLS
ncbi:hypothetical protein AB835_13935 [Candidatus Endobugula sertula]|uniref:DUF2971 domain-containing protein n=1 Tax=Candidatus Endobugula sertula TaxID=62101 RepID=A0A1D2QLM5_9GAMM|nr:hypothetical protein AB835_13935 [Candidatus Endobugula sertula]